MQLPFFHRSDRSKNEPPSEVARLFAFLRGIVNREDLIDDLWATYEQGHYIAAYMGLERFITSNKPLVVKAEYTKDTLRHEIAASVAVTGLPEELALLFAPQEKFRSLFFHLISKDLIDALLPILGAQRIQALVGGYDAESSDQHVLDGMYRALCDEVITSFGKDKVEQIVKKTLDTVQEYGQDTLSDFFAYVPQDILVKERFSYLSRESLERTVQKATDSERKKREDAERMSNIMKEQNAVLQNTKLAMINLLEDAKALEEDLKKAKESVEAKVIERTSQLREEQSRFVAAVNSVNRGFIILDNARVVILTNDILASILDSPGNTIWNYALLEQQFAGKFDLSAAVNHCMTKKESMYVPSITFGKKYLSIFMAPIYIDSKREKIIGVVITVDDITEAKILERSRDEFFSIASHELRTPLTAIRGNTSMMLDYYAANLADPSLKEMVSDVHESSVRLIDIVNDFLNVSRLEQGRMDFKLKPFDLPLLIDQALKEYQVTGSRQKLHLLFEHPQQPLPPVLADADRVREVLINLIGNALKFTDQGGVTVAVNVADGKARVTVQDTGRGIALLNQSLLFHKFQQAGDSIMTRDTTKGTGLGLYICKLIVEGMGGNIWLVKSEPEKGSTFAFTLPLAKEKSVV